MTAVSGGLVPSSAPGFPPPVVAGGGSRSAEATRNATPGLQFGQLAPVDLTT